MRREALALGLAMLAAASARADACLPTVAAEAARVGEITARGEIRLQDGRLIRLAGLGPIEAGDPALALLQRGWAQAPLVVRPVALQPDRWGRISALVETPSAVPGGPALSLNGLILSEGAALADPADVPAPCRVYLSRAEGEARQRRRGLWRETERLALARGGAEGAAMAGSFRMIEGRARSVAERRGMVFLDFGRYGEGGPSLRIARRNIAHLMPSGMKPGDLKGRHLRIRGVVEAAGERVWMTADRASLIEVLE